MAEAKIAVIGGSGFYEMEGLENRREVACETPFGRPSDTIGLGTIAGTPVAFLARHGRGHRLLPSEVPARANIYALKTLGVERIISINAAGSLREQIAPRHLVVPDGLIDRTAGRPNSFFGEGFVAHISFDEPFCPELSHVLLESARQAEATVHEGGVVVVIEGPAFSTKSESKLYRSWQADLVSMTLLPEAKLAREAGICFAALACVTDYDVWHEREAGVTAQMILDNLLLSVENAKRAVALSIASLPEQRTCGCASSLVDAVATPVAFVPAPTLEKLRPIVGDYIGRSEAHDGGK